MAKKAWRIMPRQLLETVLNDHAQLHRVRQPLILHGPRGTGKTTLIVQRLLPSWNTPPHATAYVDLAAPVDAPWTSWSSSGPHVPLSQCQAALDRALESLAHSAIALGSLTSRHVFAALDRWFCLHSSLDALLGPSRKERKAARWDRAVCALSARCDAAELRQLLGLPENHNGKRLTSEEAASYLEAVAALKLAKQIIDLRRSWRANAIRDLNQRGGFSGSLANACTDWPYILLELVSQAAEWGHFQPKLVINNIEVLKLAISGEDDVCVPGPVYHDSLIRRIIALGVKYMSLPIIFVTSDSYYSYQAFLEFGHVDIFISRENFGWTPQEAKLHMVTDYFTDSEWQTITEVLGPNPRHFFELYSLKQSSYHGKEENENGGTFEDIVDAYLAYLQISVVNPAMDRALEILQAFAANAQSGKIPKDKLRFGAPWRHPPQKEQHEWAKIQMMDMLQSLVNAGFGLNYLTDFSLEIFDDPAARALIEVGLFYVQRDPSLIRPVSIGIQRCLVRWLVQERMQLNFKDTVRYRWQRFMRGRSYRHLLRQLGYKKY